ncbi:GxxExxY protein [Fibrella aquatilis]|uniref:GxxExxY protein n=1 Tax=Fibrella aquatilis TaxID=2817059 RepID=A0A939G1U7_9BACT|nr:GxxExxY protein [Fibrella aquatilis]
MTTTSDVYDHIYLDVGYRIDLFVNHDLVVELKSVVSLQPVHLAQTLTYLRLADCRHGLILNFNVALLRDGIKSVVNGY